MLLGTQLLHNKVKYPKFALSWCGKMIDTISKISFDIDLSIIILHGEKKYYSCKMSNLGMFATLCIRGIMEITRGFGIFSCELEEI